MFARITHGYVLTLLPSGIFAIGMECLALGALLSKIAEMFSLVVFWVDFQHVYTSSL